jgi:hypothetical protein
MSVAKKGVWTGPRSAFVAVGGCALLLSLMLAIAPGVANAASELDQKQEVVSGAGIVASEASFAQTFTAGKSGTLEKVELELAQFGATPTQAITVEITEVNASGEPDITKVLGSASFGPATLPEYALGGAEWVPFNITAPSQAGTSYAIVAFSSTPFAAHYDWFDDSSNPYAGGQAWYSPKTPPAAWVSESAFDMTLRTYVAADPNTVGTPPSSTQLSHIELNGVPGTERGVAPGQDVKIKANWADNNTGCPKCADQVSTAFAGNPVAGCIENGQRSHELEPSGTGVVDLGPAPKAPGVYNVVGQLEETFTCGEQWNASASTGYHVIARVCTAPSVTTQALPPAARGTAYKAELTVCGGVPPYKWKKIGKLPKGLKLSKTGVLAGTPSTKLAPGSYPLGVEVSDSEKPKQSATTTFTLTVN